MRSGRVFVSALVLVLTSVGAREAAAAAGDLDPTFGTGGSTVTPVSTGIFGYAVVARQPDGKILVATDGETNRADLAIARYGPTGVLDPTWGDGGVVVTATSINDEAAMGIAIQPDGKVLVAAAGPEIKIARFDSTGTPDPTWGGAGLVSTGLTGGGFDGYGDILLLPDGEVLVTGTFTGDLAVARYTSSGVLDPTFGGNGLVVRDLGATAVPARLARQADGRILVTGSVGGAIATTRFFESGTPDLAFGVSGVALTNAGTAQPDVGRDVLVQPDGKILVLGQDGSTVDLDPTLWITIRYEADGSLDSGWGGTGIVETSVPGPPATSNARALVRQGDGRILAIGESLPDYTFSFDVDVATVRYGTDGSLDTSWGGTGIVVDDFGAPFELGTSAVLQADSKLVVAGTQSTLAGILVARYEVGAFCGDGIVQPSEDCDDGNAEDGDCCSSSCGFEAAGSSCVDDGLSCTAEQCDGGGSCLHLALPDGTSCEDGNPCTSGETCTDATCGGGVAGGVGCVNPFVCYKTNASKGFPRFSGVPGAALSDALETGSFDVKTPFELCVPAEVNHLEIRNPEIRQVAYKIRPSRGEPKHVKQTGIAVRDLFGTHSFDTKKAELLLAPAHLSLTEPPPVPASGDADAYKCYKVKLTRGQPMFPRATAKATEEFEDRFYDVFAPRRLCYPVDRNGLGIVEPQTLLTCYRLRRAALQPNHEKILGQIRTADDFGDLRLDTKKERDLCLPATLVP